MDGIHDLGGMDGFGRIEAEPDEPVFHAAWEGRVMAMQRAMMYAGAWNIDMLRYAQERLPPQKRPEMVRSHLMRLCSKASVSPLIRRS